MVIPGEVSVLELHCAIFGEHLGTAADSFFDAASTADAKSTSYEVRDGIRCLGYRVECWG